MTKENDAYLAWVRLQPSALSGKFSEWVEGIPMNPACHVRRAAIAGVAYKPEFSAIPLTHFEHDLQHRKGERALLEHYGHKISVQGARDFFDQLAAKYYARWLKTMETAA